MNYKLILFTTLTLIPSIAKAQYQPVCLDSATATQITTAGSSLSTSIGLDLSDTMLRLADQRCDNLKITAGALSDITNLKASVQALITQVNSIPAGPQGPQGLIGPNGKDAIVAIGAVTMGLPGSTVVVTNSGTPGAAVLNFAIPQGAVGPPAFTPYAVPAGYVIPVIADSMSGCLMSGGKCTGWTSTKNGCGIYGVCVLIGGTSGDSGSFYDANITVPQAGPYSAKMNVAVTTGSATVSGHFECPVGTPIGTWTYSNNGSVNPAVVGTNVILPAGPQTVRMVLDVAPPLSNGNATGLFNWLYLAKLP